MFTKSDERASAIGTGTMGIIIIVTLIVLVVACDLPTLNRHCRIGRRRMGCKVKKRKKKKKRDKYVVEEDKEEELRPHTDYIQQPEDRRLGALGEMESAF